MFSSLNRASFAVSQTLLKPTALLLCGLLTFSAACVSQSAVVSTANFSPASSSNLQPAIERPIVKTPAIHIQSLPKHISKSTAQKSGSLPTRNLSQLPPEAQVTVNLIYQGGPFPYDRDGITFGNREGLLPKQPYGYYREYTVETPGDHTRGARRIVAGQNGELYYTGDHYASFVRVQIE